MGFLKTSPGLMLTLGIALLLTACITQVKTGSVSGPAPLQPEYSFWPHDVSDLKPDPGVKYGVLKNGLRYAIMRNVQPAGAVSLKLRFASGSLQENDQQRGMAHFLEHMAFNGSKNVPEGEYVKLLQRKGLAFGAHTNAYTSTNETVYMLELPKNEPDLIDTGLMLFREIGDHLTLDAAAIEREKGVVLSEQRTRNTPEYRAFEARWRVWYEGQRQADRMPIGTIESIKSTNQALVSEYYHRNYRPERAFLVAVGDIDPVKLEALIAAKFADWKGEGEPTADPDMGTLKQRGTEYRTFVEPNLPEDLTVSWFQLPDRDADNLENRARDSKSLMALAVINRRLGRLARGENPPFVSASIYRSHTRNVSKALMLDVNSQPGKWQAAMGAAEQELRRATEHGFTEAEIARELKEWRAGLEESKTSASTRPSGGLARAIVAEFSGRGVFTHPDIDLAVFEDYAPGLTPAATLAALREIVQGQGPVVFLSSGLPVKGGEPALAQAYENSRKQAVAPAAQQQAKEFPYTSFGTKGEVAQRQDVTDFGITLMTFKNGVKVNFKHTAFEKDSISVTVRFAGGFLDLQGSKVGMYWALPFSFAEGGLKKLTTDELEESVAGHIVSTDLSLDDDAFEFGGQTNQRDLLLQMQLLAAYATDPAYRGLGLERLLSSAESDIKQFSSSPGRVISREVSALLRSGDARWKFPTLAQLRSIRMSDIAQVLQPALQKSPIEISIVGDVSEEQVRNAVAETFGAFAPRASRLVERPGARNVRFPSSALSLQFEHEGLKEQASAYVAWPGPDFYSDTKRARTISLLREMLKVRLTDEFREAQGATYSPAAGSTYSSAFPGFGYITASAETRPELVDSFYKTLDKVLDEFRTGGFSEDLMNRSRTPVIKNIEKSRQTNGYWAGAITDIQTEPRGLDAIRTQITQLQAISKDELVATAKLYFDGKRRVEVRVLPRKQQALTLRPRLNRIEGISKLKQPGGEFAGVAAANR